MRRPFADKRPIGPFIQRDTEPSTVPIAGFDPDSSMKRFIDKRISHSENLCDLADMYVEEVILQFPNENSEVLEVIEGSPSETEKYSNFNEDITATMAALEQNMSAVDNNQALVTHATNPDLVPRIKKEGFKSRRALGLRQVTPSDIRHTSTFFSGNVVEFDFSMFGGSAFESDEVEPSLIITLIDLDTAFWGNVTFARFLKEGEMTAEEYEDRGLVPYDELVQCLPQEGEKMKLGSFTPFSTTIDGKVVNNFQEFMDKTEFVKEWDKDQA